MVKIRNYMFKKGKDKGTAFASGLRVGVYGNHRLPDIALPPPTQ